MVGTIISGLSCSRGSWLMHLWIYAGMWALTNLPPRLADRLAAWTTVRASGRRLAQMPTHKKEGEAALAMVAHSRVFFVIAPFRVTNWFRSQLREWARDITTLLPLVIVSMKIRRVLTILEVLKTDTMLKDNWRNLHPNRIGRTRIVHQSSSPRPAKGRTKRNANLLRQLYSSVQIQPSSSERLACLTGSQTSSCLPEPVLSMMATSSGHHLVGRCRK